MINGYNPFMEMPQRLPNCSTCTEENTRAKTKVSVRLHSSILCYIEVIPKIWLDDLTNNFIGVGSLILPKSVYVPISPHQIEKTIYVKNLCLNWLILYSLII